MKMVKFLVLLTILVLPQSTNAEEPFDRSIYNDFGKKFRVSATCLPYDSDDSIKVLVMFKIQYNALPFQAVRSVRSKNKIFASEAITEISFKDSDGIIRERIKWEGSVEVDDFIMTNSKDKFLYGHGLLILPKSSFDIEFQLYDSNQRLIDKEEIELKIPEKKSGFYPLFLATKNVAQIEPFILKYSMDFNSENSTAFVFARGIQGPYRYELKKIENTQKIRSDDESIHAWNSDVNISADADYFSGRTFNVSELTDQDQIILEISKNVADSYDLIEIPLPQNQMVPGTYVLVITGNKGKDSLKQNFQVIWENMPLSLKNSSEYAAEALYYILTNKQYDEISSGDESEIFSKILDYWISRDPTPDTPFNEAMAEYYKRVDYAFFNFKTISAPDGAKTERGKVYILYGKPDEIQDKFNEKEAHRLIWYYEKIGKKFIFESTMPGKYKLKKIEKFD